MERKPLRNIDVLRIKSLRAIQKAYIKKRHEMGNATEKSFSAPVFAAVRQEGVIKGFGESVKLFKVETSEYYKIPAAHNIFAIAYLTLGVAEVFVTIAFGSKKNTRGTGDWKGLWD